MFYEIRSTNETRNGIFIMMTILLLCTHQMFKIKDDIFKAVLETWFLIILCLMFLIVCILFLKLMLLLGELFSIDADYDGSYLSVIHSINFNGPSWTVIVITVFSFMMLITLINFQNIADILRLSVQATCLALMFSLLLLYTVKVTDCRSTKVAAVFSSGGLDPGTAMACSFFYGYLKIILPASGGNERAGILYSLGEYESNNKIEIPVKKLFILIPSSSYISPDLREVSDDWLESTSTFQIITLDRAGVKGRPYHNTLYKLHPDGPDNKGLIKPIYLAVEGATPLKTFLETQNQSPRYGSIYREFSREVIRNFYTTLENLLNESPDTRNYCELVYYEDTVDGKKINPAQILLDRVQSYVENKVPLKE